MRIILSNLLTVILLVNNLGIVIAQEKAVTPSRATYDSVYSKVLRLYADKLDPSRIILPAINASLNTLDPYTYYMDSAMADQFRFELQARFAGVGLVIKDIDGAVTVMEVFNGSPGDKAGLKPGDILLEIDGKTLQKQSYLDVFPLLRGEPGSKIELRYSRKGMNKSMLVTAIREEISISSVPYYSILENGTGYIRLAGETRGSAADVKKALLALKENKALKSLILDLRGNIGGYMDEAIKTVNLFVQNGKPVLSIRSWYRDTTYYLADEPVDLNIPLVILTDSLTASSAEILTGALQDHDRAMIIGGKTFGKGLIQELFEMPHGEMLSITTGYYHTPSGRCIQRKDYSKNTSGVLIADTARKYFKTAKGRLVVDHDGIVPDIIIQMPAKAIITQALSDFWTNNQVFRFASQFASTHSKIVSAKDFSISDEDFNSFVQFLKKEKLVIPDPSESKLNEFESTLQQQGNKDLGRAEIKLLRLQLKREREKEFYKYKNELKALLEGEIAALYYYNWGRIENGLRNDVVIKKAIATLRNTEVD